jgi:hypothetical protein
MITWPVPDPVLPETVDPVLAEVINRHGALAEELAAVIGGS